MAIQLFKTKNLYWLIFAGVLCFAALNRHSRTKVYTYRSQLMSDKAGYYVYLPALFLYDFKANMFPTKVDSLTGNGFFLDLKSNKVQTKYPIGTALFESPFFLAAHVYVTLSGGNADGFSKPYQDALDFSAVFYLVLGLIVLRKFLLAYFPNRIVLLGLGLILFGTNLYYYTVFEGAYSHVYSFFLFSTFLYLLQRYSTEQKRIHFIGLFAVAAGILLVRQINIVFILSSLFLIKNPIQLLSNSTRKDWLLGFLAASLILLPQLVYNIYLTGGPFFYSYQNEGFIYWRTPKIKEVLFGFENGLFTTNPILLLGALGFIPLIKQHKNLGLIALLSFLACTYLYASWWAWQLGCAYGHRGFVDIYPMFILPICAILFWVQHKKNKLFKILFYAFCILGVVFNLKYIYTYDSCWPQSIGLSDFEIYWHFLTSQTK